MTIPSIQYNVPNSSHKTRWITSSKVILKNVQNVKNRRNAWCEKEERKQMLKDNVKLLFKKEKEDDPGDVGEMPRPRSKKKKKKFRSK